ncbi:glycosyltransferase family 4 protein [Peristeroidobacter agariperforans]|uniref:glycosyltransferase family 4 protein n=1 Tax=Peristeroidobacter agariperforans TaxID=268404 RepID=UPI00101D6318|nr:glycosyltransferase family 4 protein [Peristeroidobacter agariperforans]
MRESSNVLMLGPGLNVRGGVSGVERLLLSALPENVHATHIATMVDGGKWTKAVTFAQSVAKLTLQLNRHPDVVHIHFASGASNIRKIILARVALARGASVIMHAHGGGYQKHWATMSPATRAITLSTLQSVQRLVVLGEGWKAFFESIGVPKHRIVVLPNPVVLPESVPVRGLGGKVSFVYFGLISRRKGVFDLTESVARLSPECRARVEFVLAGHGDVAQLREHANKLGVQDVVQIREWVDPAERDRLLAAAHAFVLPSHTEGLPMSLLEAMAWGLPPICTPVGSIPEYVVNGANGLLIAPGDVSQLAAAIEKLVLQEEDRVQMGRLARATVEPLCVKQYSDRMCAVYRAVANGNGRRAG